MLAENAMIPEGAVIAEVVVLAFLMSLGSGHAAPKALTTSLPSSGVIGA